MKINLPKWARHVPIEPCLLVYGELPHGELVFIEKPKAIELALMHDAIWNSRTWAEFRLMMPARRLPEALERAADYLGLESVSDVPKGKQKFDGLVLGTGEGTWPEWPAQEMCSWVPREIERLYGACESSVHDGLYTALYARFEEEIVRAFGEEGFECVRDDELALAAAGCIERRFRRARRPQLEAELGAV